MHRRVIGMIRRAGVAGLMSLALASSAGAASFFDPAGDYLGSYIGPLNGDLDILSGSVGYDTSNLLLTTKVSGTVGATAGSLFLWGVNRGAGTDRLITSGPPAVGPATILLDAVVRLNGDDTGAVLTFPVMGPPTTVFLNPAWISISGDTLSASIPRSLLPSTGFAFADYTYINWSRSAFGTQDFIADLAPDDESILASFVPEPATWAMMIVGFGAVGLAARRRRGAKATA